MAHTIDGKGPYPDKAGEFCGNHRPGSPATCYWDQSPLQAKESQRHWLALMRFGRPSNCKTGTSEEMAAQGWVGLYLKEDRPLYGRETSVETDELTEPIVAMRMEDIRPAMPEECG